MKNKFLGNVFLYLIILSFTLGFWSIYLNDGLSTFTSISLGLMIIFAIPYYIFSNESFFEISNHKNEKVYIITKIIYAITLFLAITLISINTKWALVFWLIFLILFLMGKKNQKK